jgi:hypothetical protein
MSTSRLLILCLGLGALACFSDPNTSDGESDAGTGEAGDGDGDTGEEASTSAETGDGDTGGACGAGMVCADPVPAGWSGPVVVSEDAGAVECPSEFPSLVQELHAGLSADSAECGCECGQPSDGIACSATLFEDDPGCDQNVFMADQWALDQADCIDIATDTTAFRVVAGELQANDSSCEAIASENVPEPSWETNTAACQVSNPDSCSVGGTCQPDTAASLCIWVEGDTDCPAGPYETQIVRYLGVEDTRGCSECSCGSPEGSCGGDVELLTSGCGIMGVLEGKVDVDAGCADINEVPTFAEYKAQVVDAACPANGGETVGEALPASPVTFCCTQ